MKLLPLTLLLLFAKNQETKASCHYEKFSDDVDETRVLCDHINDDFDLNVQNPTTVKSLIIDERTSTVKILKANNPLTKFVNLESLIIQEVGLEEVQPGAFHGLTKLNTLALSNNKIQEIQPGVFSDCVALNTLYLTGNSLEKIVAGAFDNLKNLETLFLAKNKITHIDDNSFKDLENLADLALNENQISILQDDIFKELLNLVNLDVKQNPLKEVHNIGLQNKVKNAIFSHGQLEHWNYNFSHFHIQEFTLGENQLTEFDFTNVNPASRYSFIGLSGNRITTLKNFEYANFEEIYINNNQLTEFKNIPKGSESIKAGNNKIKHLEHVSNPEDYQLLTLDLSNNEIESATCLGLSKLESLRLTHNHITSIKQHDLELCTGLKDLYLAFNQIQLIESQAFKGLRSLSSLDLSNNKLTELNPSNFEGLTTLNSLSFNDNAINYLNIEDLMKILPGLSKIDFTTTDFYCDELQTVIEALKSHKIMIFFDTVEASAQCKVKTVS